MQNPYSFEGRDDPNPVTAPYTIYIPRRGGTLTSAYPWDTLEDVIEFLESMEEDRRVEFYFGTGHFEGETAGEIRTALKRYAPDGRTYRHYRARQEYK